VVSASAAGHGGAWWQVARAETGYLEGVQNFAVPPIFTAFPPDKVRGAGTGRPAGGEAARGAGARIADDTATIRQGVTLEQGRAS